MLAIHMISYESINGHLLITITLFGRQTSHQSTISLIGLKLTPSNPVYVNLQQFSSHIKMLSITCMFSAQEKNVDQDVSV